MQRDTGVLTGKVGAKRTLSHRYLALKRGLAFREKEGQRPRGTRSVLHGVGLDTRSGCFL